MAQRQYTQKEWRLLGWWLATFHQHADIYLNPRMGPLTQRTTPGRIAEQPEMVSRVFHRYADAVFVESGDPTIVEAKLVPDPGIFSQLIHYARLFRSDPQWAEFRSRPLTLVALVYQDDPRVSEEAPYYGVKWVVYQPNLDQLAPPRVMDLMTTSGIEPPLLPDSWPARLNSWGVKALS